MNSLANIHPVTAGASDNPLLMASPGLMIWTVVMFFITLFILKKFEIGRAHV